MKLLKRLVQFGAIFAWMALCVGVVLAQSPSPGPSPDPGVPSVVSDTVAKVISAVSLVLIPVIVGWLRGNVLNKIPRILIPLVVLPGLTSAINYVTALASGGTVSWLAVAGLTTGALFLREVYTTLAEHGLSP